MNRKKSIKFFLIYDSLSNDEKNQFVKFLQLELVPVRISKNILKHLNSGFNLKEYLYENFSERSVWNACSELTGALDLFLAVKEITVDKSAAAQLLRKQLNKRDLNSILLREYKNKIDGLLKARFETSTFKKVSETALEFLLFAVKIRNAKLQRQAYNLYFNFYSLNCLFETISLMIDNAVTYQANEKSDPNLLDELNSWFNFDSVMKSIKISFPQYYQICTLYFEILCLMRNERSNEHYYKVKNSFFSIMGRLSDESRIRIFENLAECLIVIRENEGFDTDRELFELFKKKIALKLVDDLTLNKIGFNHFRDYVLIALNTGEVRWAKKFVEKYSGILPEKQRYNDKLTAESLIRLHKGKYEEALELISLIRKSYYIHYNDYFRISIKANFELGNYDACQALSDRYRDYLRRSKKLPKPYIEGSKAFLRNIKLLINYVHSSDESILDELEFELSKKAGGSDKKWISSRLKSFYKRRSVKKVS